MTASGICWKCWKPATYYNEELQAWECSECSPLKYRVQPPKKVGRNDPCPCGSGKKYKKCCAY